MREEKAALRIVQVYTEAQREYVTIINSGNLAQSLNGWTLVTLRQNRAFVFTAGFVLPPGKLVTIHSGPAARENPPDHIIWTRERIWNDIADVAVLFNADGVEVDRFAYPHEHALGKEARRHKRLVFDGLSYQLTNAPVLSASGVPA